MNNTEERQQDIKKDNTWTTLAAFFSVWTFVFLILQGRTCQKQADSMQEELAGISGKLDTLSAAVDSMQADAGAAGETLDLLDEEINDLISAYYDENGLSE